ncbi:MAG: hypothetical protein RBQ78_06445 [Acholeplasmataceae bacterium]|jgi:hypothetical protein|nr:hypothetical protein [Acholeplasmataceae bacterium]
MKKFYVSIFVLLILTLFGVKPLFASESELPENSNYLDISNLEMIPGYSKMAKTINPIYVIPQTTYTVVMDLGFIGVHEMSMGSVGAIIKDVSSGTTQTKLLLADYPNNRAYFEFTPNSNYIHFTELPIDPENYKAIMYEGTYQDFIRFETYAHESTITNYYGVIPMDYDQQLSDVAIKNLVTAKNPFGQTISVTIESSTYLSSNNLPGSYQMVLVANHLETYKRYILDIRVFDVTKPVISAPASINVPISDRKTIDQIKAMITVTDNVDTLSSSNLVVTNDTYSSATQVGNYSITFEISDSSQNVSSLTVPISITDTRGPVITGPLSIFIYATDEPLTQSNILSRYTAFDTEEGVSKTITIKSDGYIQKTIPGVYDIHLESVDNLGNKTLMIIKIHVIDNRGPVFTANDLILSITTANQMTDQELIDWFYQKASLLGVETSNVNIYFNEYEKNISLGGSYYVYMTYEYENQEQMARILVNVEEVNDTPWLTYGIFSLAIVSASVGFIIIKKRK